MATLNANQAAMETALVAGIRAGREDSLSQLYDRYSGVVYAVALRVLGDTGAAEDILQDIFLQLWRNPQSFDSSRGSLGAWLSVIARNRAIDALRRRKPQDDIDDVILAGGVDFEDETARKVMVAKVRGILGGMNPDQRRAVEMAFFEGLTHTEIAGKTGEALGTIKTRIRTALLSLRKALEG